MKLLLFVPWLMVATAAQAVEFHPLLQLEGRGIYENQQVSARSDFGSTANLFVVPALDFGPRWSLAPVLAYLREGRGLVIEEGSFFTSQNTFLAKPVLRYRASSAWDLKAWGSAKRAVNQEAEGEAWSIGLYDFEEFGGGVGLDWHPGGGLEKASLGLEVMHRGYPNWHELGATATRGLNYYSKDYNGWKLALDLAGDRKAAWGWKTGVTVLQKYYSDSLLVNAADGTLDYDKLRSDNLIRYNLGGRASFTPQWSANLDLAVDWNNSNQNFYDGAFGQREPGFYDYLSVGGGPSLTWTPSGNEGPGLTASLSLTNRTYDGRLVRHSDGSYTRSKQADFEQRYGLDGRWPIFTKGLALVGGLDYLLSSSNQGFEQNLRYTYDLFNANLGLQYRL